ncbi:MAG: tetratricopeptide repeat protein [Armatimonadetes bacterium]|nr:tetratricopeptide repeat protein [Armatimonadota bacterium]
MLAPVLAALTLALASVPGGALAQSADDLFREGEALYTGQQFAQAAERFAAALRFRPNDPYIMVWLGYALLSSCDYQQALATLTRALPLLPPGTRYHAMAADGLVMARSRNLTICAGTAQQRPTAPPQGSQAPAPPPAPPEPAPRAQPAQPSPPAPHPRVSLSDRVRGGEPSQQAEQPASPASPPSQAGPQAPPSAPLQLAPAAVPSSPTAPRPSPATPPGPRQPPVLSPGARLEQPVLAVGDSFTFRWSSTDEVPVLPFISEPCECEGESVLTLSRIGTYQAQRSYFFTAQHTTTNERNRVRSRRYSTTIVYSLHLERLAVFSEGGELLQSFDANRFRWPMTPGAQHSQRGTFRFLPRGSSEMWGTIFHIVVEIGSPALLRLPGPVGEIPVVPVISKVENATVSQHRVEVEEYFSPAVRFWVRGSFKEQLPGGRAASSWYVLSGYAVRR